MPCTSGTRRWVSLPWGQGHEEVVKPHVGLAADLGRLFIPWGSPAEPESPGPHCGQTLFPELCLHLCPSPVGVKAAQAGGGGRVDLVGREGSLGCVLFTDDPDLRGAHREVQDAAGRGEQPDREHPAGEEVGREAGRQSLVPSPKRSRGPPRLRERGVWLECAA